ncbi:MAG: hypothetical protein ACI9A2_001840, partial [Halioglobus sp.]
RKPIIIVAALRRLLPISTAGRERPLSEYSRHSGFYLQGSYDLLCDKLVSLAPCLLSRL